MDPKGIILIIINVVGLVSIYSWAICRQIDKEKEEENK